MAYKSLKKVIEAENKALREGEITSEEYETWKSSTIKKMDVFLVCDRISDAQYSELNSMFVE